MVPIVTQNQNGPCPLIAIVNVLLLRRKIFLPLDMQSITSEQLMDHIGEQLLENTPQVDVYFIYFFLFIFVRLILISSNINLEPKRIQTFRLPEKHGGCYKHNTKT